MEKGGGSKGGGSKGGRAQPRKKWGPEGWGPEGWCPKISPAAKFVLFFPLWVSSRGNLVVFEAPGRSNVHVWTSRAVVCEPRRPGLVGPLGFHTTTREPKRAHLSTPVFKNTTKFQREDTQRGKKRTNFCGGRGKKKSETLGGPGEGWSWEGRSWEGRSWGRAVPGAPKP